MGALAPRAGGAPLPAPAGPSGRPRAAVVFAQLVTPCLWLAERDGHPWTLGKARVVGGGGDEAPGGGEAVRLRRRIDVAPERTALHARGAPRRIDVHFHLIPPFYSEAVYAAGRGPAIGHRRQVYFASLGGFDTHQNQMAANGQLAAFVAACRKEAEPP